MLLRRLLRIVEGPVASNRKSTSDPTGGDAGRARGRDLVLAHPLTLWLLALGALPWIESNLLAQTEGAAGAVPTIRGKVLVVNPQTKYVVLNVGEKDGVKKGYTFRAYRDTDFVGLLQVNLVKQDLCVAEVSHQARPVKGGDHVTTRLLEADTSKSEPAASGPLEKPARQLPLPAAQGKVLAVRNDLELVIFGMSKARAVTPGQKMIVGRGTEWIGSIEVTEVNDSLCVGNITMQKHPIRSGDTIFVREKGTEGGAP